MCKPLVFIHGSGDSAHIWQAQVEYFTNLGKKQIFAIDLPGHGQQQDIFPPEVTIQDYTRFVYEMITQELELEQAIIAGHSLGGAIALMMALDYRTATAGLILVGTGARLRVHPTILEDARQRPQLAHARLLAWSTIPAHLTRITPEGAAEQAEQVVTPGTFQLYRDLLACNHFDIMSRLHEIQVPTCVICGANDGLTPVKYSQFLHEQMNHSSLYIIPETGHYVINEQPDQVNKAIEEWLKEYYPSPPKG